MMREPTPGYGEGGWTQGTSSFPGEWGECSNGTATCQMERRGGPPHPFLNQYQTKGLGGYIAGNNIILNEL
jgi:hypothetical protein